MKLHVEFSIFLSLLLPMAAKDDSGARTVLLCSRP